MRSGYILFYGCSKTFTFLSQVQCFLNPWKAVHLQFEATLWATVGKRVFGRHKHPLHYKDLQNLLCDYWTPREVRTVSSRFLIAAIETPSVAASLNGVLLWEWTAGSQWRPVWDHQLTFTYLVLSPQNRATETTEENTPVVLNKMTCLSKLLPCAFRHAVRSPTLNSCCNPVGFYI